MNDFLAFRKMITPVVLQVLFWIAILGVIIYAFVAMFGQNFWMGLAILIFGPILTRIYFELMLVLFKINDTLTDIRKNTKKE